MLGKAKALEQLRFLIAAGMLAIAITVTPGLAHPTAGSAHSTGKIGGTAPAARLPQANLLPLKKFKSNVLTVKSAATIASPADQAPTVSAITADTTLGTNSNTIVTHPSGSTLYTITGGKLVGQNAFESFSQFTVGTGDTAQFQIPASNGNATINNILVRVTSNTASTIDGIIQTRVGSSNTQHPATFYLMNPNGVIFNQNASFDIGGSLVITTANYLTLGNSVGSPGHFSATLSGTQKLTDGNPTALGFTANTPAGVTINGQNLANTTTGMQIYEPTVAPAPGNSLTVVSGPINVTGGELATTDSSAANVISVAAAGVVQISSAGSANLLSYSPSLMLGDINVSAGGVLGSFADNFASINVGNSGAATIIAADINVSGIGSPVAFNSTLGSYSFDGNAGPVSLHASGLIDVSGFGFVGSGGAVASSVIVTAGSLRLDESNLACQSGTGTPTGSFVFSSPHGAVTIVNGGFLGIYGGTGSPLNAVTVTAASVSVDGTSTETGGGSQVGILVDSGTSGSVQLNVSGNLTVTGSSAIGSLAFEANSGPVTVMAGNVVVSGSKGLFSTSQLGSFATNGASGPLRLTVNGGNVSVAGGAIIGSQALYGGNSGSVQVEAADVSVDGADSQLASFSTAGTSGIVTLTASNALSVTNGGTIQASAGRTGIAGQININSPQITLDGQNSIFQTGIFVSGLLSAQLPDSGADLTVLASDTLSVTNNAAIAADAFGTSRAGSILISGNVTTLSASASVTARSFDGGAGGKIQIGGTSLSLTGSSFISADNYSGTLAGGEVDVNEKNVALDTASFISARGGAALANPLTVKVDFSSTEGSGLENIFLTSPQGTRIQLDNFPRVSFTSLYSDATLTTNDQTVDIQPIGFLSNFTAEDLDGTWQLSLANGQVPISLVSWSLSMNGVQISSNDVPKSGTSFSSSLVVANVDPGLTAGSGGDVNITSNAITVMNGSRISAETLGKGDAGSVNITAATVLVNGAGSSIDSQTAAPPNGQLTTLAGNAGKVNVNAAISLSLAMGGTISSTAATSAGGDVNIQTPVLTVTGASAISSSGLEAGKVNIVSPSISLSGNSAISTDTQQPNPVGSPDVTLNTTTLSMTDNSKITALTSGAAVGGTIAIGPLPMGGANPTVTLTTGSVIAADTSAAGPSGSVNLQVASLSMDTVSRLSASNIGTGAPGTDGAAGSVVIVADTSITLDHNSQIATNGGILGVPGFVQIQTPTLTMQNGALITDDVTSPDRAGAAQSAIGIAVGSLSLDTNSQISAGTVGTANGGRIAVGPIGASATWPIVTLAGNSNITAGTGAAATGSAGDITIQSSNFTATNSLVQSQNAGTGPAGGIQIESLSDISITNSTLSVSAVANSAGKLLVAGLGSIDVSNSKITAVSSGSGVGGTVTFAPPPATIGMLPAIVLSNGTLVSADTTATGSGGSVLMNVASLGMDQSTISASNAGTGAPGTDGAAGSVVIMTPAAGVITLNHNSKIFTNGGFTGAAGSIQLTTGTLSLQNASAITNDATSPDQTAVGSSVGFAVGTLTLNTNSQISAGSAGTADGGTIAIGPINPTAPLPVVYVSGSSNITAGTATTATGSAGDITIQSATFSALNSLVQSQSLGTGPAGGIDIEAIDDLSVISSTLTVSAAANSAGKLRLAGDGSMEITASSITAISTGTGVGGTITLGPPAPGDALPAVTLLGSLVSADTKASGPAGNVLLNVESLTMTESTISSSNAGTGLTGADGAAGSVVIQTAALGLVTLDASQIFTNGGYTGAPGRIQISSPSISLIDASTISNNVESPDQAPSQQSAVGFATGHLSLKGDSSISAITTGTGNGGRIAIGPLAAASRWPVVLIRDGSGISASSGTNASGVAGDVTVQAGNLSLNNGRIETASNGTGAAGGLSITSRANVLMINSTLSVNATQNNGGDLTVDAPNLIHLTDSSILASAANLGGKITIDPSLVLLDGKSVINGLAGGEQQPVTIGAAGFLLSPSSVVLTDQPQFAVDTTIASTIGRLAGAVAETGVTLADQCGVYFSDDVISSFVVTGRGGTPIEPGGWAPTFELAPADKK